MTTLVGHVAEAPGAARLSPALRGIAGIAVLLVMLQSTGGFTVELLGPDVLLAVAGFAVTHGVLVGVGLRWAALRRWYHEQVLLRSPLLLVVLAAVLAIAALVGQGVLVAREIVNVFAGLWPPVWSGLGPPVGPLGRVDPLGPLWLIGLLVLFALTWPVVLVAIRKVLPPTDGIAALTVLAPALLSCAAAFWLVGRMRWVAGADLAELALGAHVRLAEWLIGCAAAAAVVGMGAARSAAPSTQPRLIEVLLRSAWFAGTLAGLGAAGLIAMSAFATWRPEYWLGAGGPACAAGAAAAVLLAAHLPVADRPAGALGRGFPLELGRMAYPLLVLHSAVFWALQLAFPGARPFALLVVGGALAWLCGLLLHDGVVRRWQARGAAMTGGSGAVVLTTLIAGTAIALTAFAAPPARGPAVLVLGGSTAGELAAALDGAGGPYTVVDGSRPTCGLLATVPASGSPARTTALAQVPAAVAVCGDWPQSWPTLVEMVQPAAVVVELGADAAPRARPTDPGPCDPAFRAGYRSLVQRAVGIWTAGAPARPVLLATVRDDGTDSSARCLNALVAESAGSYRQVAQLDVNRQLCPDGTCRTHTLDGRPLFRPDGRLSPAGLDELGAWLDSTVTGSLGPR